MKGHATVNIDIFEIELKFIEFNFKIPSVSGTTCQENKNYLLTNTQSSHFTEVRSR